MSKISKDYTSVISDILLHVISRFAIEAETDQLRLNIIEGPRAEFSLT